MKRGAQLFLFIILAAIQTKSFSQQTLFSEEQFRNYFQKNRDNLNPIEGIWRVGTVQEYYRNDTLYDVDKIPKSARVAILKKDETYESFSLNGEPYNAQFTPTEMPGAYFYRNYFQETGEYSSASAVIGQSGKMSYSYRFPDRYTQKILGEGYEEGMHVMNVTSWEKVFPENKK